MSAKADNLMQRFGTNISETLAQRPAAPHSAGLQPGRQVCWRGPGPHVRRDAGRGNYGRPPAPHGVRH